MLLDLSSPLGAFAKILLESPRFTNSEEFCYVWSVWDTRLDCSAFRLIALAPSTEENGCSLWQTPVADDAIDRENGKFNSRGEPKLSAQVKLWPTLQAHDWKSTSHGNQGNARLLSEVGMTGSGSLNPRFVEELMGFPIDHTALKRSATPSYPSKLIRSSQRLHK